MFNSHRGRLRFLRMPFGAKKCPGVIGIHDNVVIFGVDREDHDANLINLLNVYQKEGLILNSKKLELRRESHLLWSQVQQPRHASRPLEDTGDHRDDSAHGQATATIVSRYGKLHGDLYSKAITPHGASKSNA